MAIETMLSQKNNKQIRNTLIQIQPNGKYHKGLIKEYKDIIEYKDILKKATYNEPLFEKILDIVVDLVQQNKRFRKNELFSILKRMYKKGDVYASKRIIEKIFFLYKELILATTDTVSWALSVMLKDSILEDNQLKWLISNADKSEHVLNRLLRYPVRSKLLSAWALTSYNKGMFKNRTSELVGLIINEVPDFTCNNKKVMIWAAYYSHANKKQVKKILFNNLDNNTIDDFLEVVVRLNLVDFLDKVYSENKVKP